VGEFGWLTLSVLGAVLVTSLGAGVRRARGVTPRRIVRLDEVPPPDETEGMDLTIVRHGSSVVVTLSGRIGRPGTQALAAHLGELVAEGCEHVVVDVATARPAARVMEALALASPELERHRVRISLVPPRGEMLSASVQLTAIGFGGWIDVYDSVAEAARAVGHTHSRP
jgi:hypothetical protein